MGSGYIGATDNGSKISPGSRALHRLDFRAMGSGFSLVLASENEEAGRARLNAAWAFIQLAESLLSRFKPDSQISRLNASSGEPVRVSPMVMDVIFEALSSAERSGGLYDPTVLTALEIAGYDRSFEAVPGPRAGDVAAALNRAPWRDVCVDEDSMTVRLPYGTRIDVGGIAKGWTAERAADILAPLGPCVVDAGGDIAARGRPPAGMGWRVGVADPLNPERDLAVVEIGDGGVATSGVDHRRWRRDGEDRHHIIDPRTGLPARTDLLTATVEAPDAVQAEVSALVALVLGSRRGLEYVESQPDTEGLFVDVNGETLATPGFHRYVVSGPAAHSWTEEAIESAAGS